MTLASTIISAETSVTKDQLWAMASLLRHNWITSVKIKTSYATSISSGASDAESRRGQIGKPDRSIDVQLDTFDTLQVAELRSILARLGNARSLVPLFPDQSILTAAAAIGDTIVYCDTACRRWVAGSRVLITSDDARTEPVFESRLIASVNGASLSLSEPLVNAYAAGAIAVPVIEADLLPSASSQVNTDQHLSAKITFLETQGASALEPTCAPNSTSDFAVYQSLPILDIEPDYSRGGVTAGMQRTANSSLIGLGRYIEVFGPRSRATYTLPFLALDRPTAYRLMQFFDGRCGRLFPFFVVSPSSDFTLVSYASTTLTVAPLTPSFDWTLKTHIALIQGDGTPILRGIASVSRGSGNDVVTLTDALPAISLPIIRAAMAHLSRFNSDAMTEEWLSDARMQTSLDAIELSNEHGVDLAVAAIRTGSGSIGRSGPSIPPGTGGPGPTPVYYREASPCDGVSSTVWVAESLLGPTLPVVFFDPSQLACYTVSDDSPRETSHGTLSNGFAKLFNCGQCLVSPRGCPPNMPNSLNFTGNVSVNGESPVSVSATLTLSTSEPCRWDGYATPYGGHIILQLNRVVFDDISGTHQSFANPGWNLSSNSGAIFTSVVGYTTKTVGSDPYTVYPDFGTNSAYGLQLAFSNLYISISGGSAPPMGGSQPFEAVSAIDWPTWASAISSFKSDADSGVGDTVARKLGSGGHAFKAILEGLGIPCGCDQRQMEWNQKYPYRGSHG